ncbi:N-6 DNA methylase [bacterium]|nr:N-6 DNA methylase [bacterium]
MKPEEIFKQNIQSNIKQFKDGEFLTHAEELFTTLGYASDYKAKLDKKYLCDHHLNQEKTLIKSWLNADLLFQVTGDDISKQELLFEANFNIDRIQSYLFYAIELEPKTYPRGALAQITREVNKLFPMPVFILFKYGDYLTFAIIDRRQNKKDEFRDVLEKVTLIKDISIASPHRAHIEILFDLSFEELRHNFKFTNFRELHAAWQKTLDTKELNKKFYRELSAWYFYAKQNVLFPDDVEKDADKRNSINLIRLITRLIFVWFVKEKGLVPEELFDEDFLKDILNYSDKTGSTYYKAILQNLFFATLNLEMNKDKPGSRKFVERTGFTSQQYLVPAYRYRRFFRNPDQALSLFENIPFLNGGLFENLDYRIEETRDEKRIDCFSDREQNEERLSVPDELFFSDLKKVDLSSVYENKKRQSEEFRGIINIFKRYKFTIEENTPIEEEIALDPELLGKVFENLLASYNPETHTTARKATGSFYTPREIVNYMVDESIIAFLETQMKEKIPELQAMETLNELLRESLSYTEKAHPFDSREVDVIINAIDNCKILDPACGSGAFPMGILHKLVYLLHKLDPQNEKWMNRQIERVKNAMREAEHIEDTQIRENLIRDLERNIGSIEDAFLNNELDYGRKLYLIENCIYGVDIQPIAIQIAKLRFFISLVIDQKVDPSKPNLNIRALPNLETKFVAANTLIGLDKPAQIALRNHEIDRLENELKEVRKNHFSARSRKEKIRLRRHDEELRSQIATLLIADGWFDKSAKQLADWNPYNQNTSSPFFDPGWMFGITGGFDIVIGNPPYINVELVTREVKNIYAKAYKTFYKRYDVFGLFFEHGLQILSHQGTVALIVPSQVLNNLSFKKLRELILNNRWLKEVFYLGDKIFEAANNDVCVLFLHKPSVNSILLVNALDFENHTASEVPVNYFDKYNGILSFSAGSSIDGIADKIFNSAFKPVRINFEVFQGIVTGNNDVYVLTQEQAREARIESNLLRPVLLGRDFEKWMFRNVERQILYIDGDIKLEKYPNAYSYLSKFKKEILAAKSIDEKSTQWYSLHRPREKINLDFTPKILVQGTRNPRLKTRVVATLDTIGVYGTQGVNFILPKTNLMPIEFLLGILNSSVINYLYKTKFLNVAIKAEFLKDTPIPSATVEQQNKIEKLVTQILTAKRVDPQADTTVLEREIDRLVYQLYGLTDEEKAVVEGKS